MGNSSNKKQGEDQTEHQKFGPVRLEVIPSNLEYNDPHHEEEQENYLMHITRTLESEKIYRDWVKAMEQIQDTETRQILLLPQKYNFETVGLCGSGGVAKLTFEYYEFVLKTEIMNRSQLKKDFIETQIWYLLYNIVRAGHKFEHLKRKIGNIHPNNILINQSGQIKIISTCSLPGELNNYDLLLEEQNNQNVIVYLAPEEINNDLIQKGSYPSHVDPCLAEVFSIGLTILSSGTLEDCDSVYRRTPYEIRKDRLNSLLRTFHQKYSDFLYQTVASMVALNPQDRKKSSEIYRALSEYEPQIMELEPFQVQNYRPPQRLSNQNVSYQQSGMNYYPPKELPSYSHPQYYNPQQVQPQYYQIPSTGTGIYPSAHGQSGVPIYHRGLQ